MNYMVTDSFYRDFKQQFAALKLNFETHNWKPCPVIIRLHSAQDTSIHPLFSSVVTALKLHYDIN